jgi:hypothetical protein
LIKGGKEYMKLDEKELGLVLCGPCYDKYQVLRRSKTPITKEVLQDLLNVYVIRSKVDGQLIATCTYVGLLNIDNHKLCDSTVKILKQYGPAYLNQVYI